MAEELRIEKEREAIKIVTAGGAKLSGHIFVQPYNPKRGGKERPIDVLNATDPYFALQTSEGFILVAKSAIVEAEYTESEEGPQDGMLPMDVVVSLTNGQKYTGVIWVEGPVNTPRLQDFMNRGTPPVPPFLILQRDELIRLINRSCIETIRSK